jgi:dienelactone hydrolase
MAVATLTGLVICGWALGAPSNPQSAIQNPQSAEMMAQYLQHEAQQRFESWRQRYEQRKTPEQITAYQKDLREQFLQAIGGLPERTPLNPRVTGVIQREGYRVEKVIFESQPKHYVTALLFLPDGAQPTWRGRPALASRGHPGLASTDHDASVPAEVQGQDALATKGQGQDALATTRVPQVPGVIVPCGHASEAKAYEAYQTMGASLALHGMAALVFDPIDQGERSQMPSALPKLQGTIAHTTLGVGSILLGRNTARFEIWDGMRAIDYLQSRPEIDPNRIGCTGNSGGGTQTSYLMALDDRIKAAAPSCYITSFEALLSTIGPQDAEQNIFGQIAFGMDHADYLMMRAPTAILICAATKDFFDIQGTWTSLRYAKRLYTRLGVPEQISLLENDAEHNYNAVQRTGVVRWMARWLLGNDKPITEPKIELLTGDEARCTPDGQVMHLEAARSTYDLNRDYEEELTAQRKRLWGTAPRADMLNRVRQIAGIRSLAELPQPKTEELSGAAAALGNMTVRNLTIIPEDGIRLSARQFNPMRERALGTVLYLHENGKEADAGPGGPIEKLVATGRSVVAVDLRGTGETQAKRGGGDLFGTDTRDVLTAYLLGRSYVGMRAEDILNCARAFRSTITGPVDLIAVGHMCVPALHAAALEPQLFGSVKLIRGLVSWSNVIELGQSRNQLVNTVHGALTTYDLPDLARTLGDRLTIEEPLNALGEPAATQRTVDGTILKDVLDSSDAGENLLSDSAWRPFGQGFKEDEGVFTCDNGLDAKVQRGLSQTVTLNQTRPEPIVATAWSQAQNVGGSRDSDYALYLDLVYQDGSPLWGQVDAFNAGSHDWEKAQVTVFPEKPVKSVTVNLLLRSHTGVAQFHAAELRPIRPPMGACLFDGIAVSQQARPREGFQVRDVAADSAFVGIEGSALDLKLECKTTSAGDRRVAGVPPAIRGQDALDTGAGDATFFDVTLSDTSGKDRAVTLVYAVPVSAQQCRWLHDPRETREVEPGREYLNAGRFAAGSNGRLSRYPFAAVANASQAVALGIDMAQPAFFRAGYNAGTQELFLAYDLGLAPEKPTAHLRFCKFSWRGRPALGVEGVPPSNRGQDARDTGDGLATNDFRAALARYYDLFPESFRRRAAQQGLWMPFAKISAVKGWEDFGFRFKEGDNETAWDDAHGIVTFRYTEPMTWWMSMPKDMPRTIEAALAEAKRLATERKDSQAMALLTSGYHDEQGRYAARLLDTPWCNGAVWSINSMPQVAGDVTDFKNKWGPSVRERLYGRSSMGVPPMSSTGILPVENPDIHGRDAHATHGQDARATGAAGLDGEYIDSSEGYVTDELDFRRDHFAIAQTPLTFSLKDHKPAIFRGLIAFEYTRALAQDVHAMDKLMMANSTPINLCWLAPLLDVMGTETDWNPDGTWRPMSDSELLYRRALCKGKPYCFLMNTEFERFSHEAVERYMKRSLAYGMFPGFFSHNASQGHYFTRPELYERDRDLFKKYVPLCKLVAEAGWEPITCASSGNKAIRIERFGDQYLTIFNDSNQSQEATITAEMNISGPTPELVSGRNLDWRERKAMITLAAEDVAVLRLR